jgi:hypothetical protein
MRFMAIVAAEIPQPASIQAVQAAHDGLFTTDNVASFRKAGNISHRAYLDGRRIVSIDLWDVQRPEQILDFYHSQAFRQAEAAVGVAEPEVTVCQDPGWASFGDQHP